MDIPAKRAPAVNFEAGAGGAGGAGGTMGHPDAAVDVSVPVPSPDAAVADADVPGRDAPGDAWPRDAMPLDANCTGTLVAWYPDGDRDGYGRSDDANEIHISCVAPGPAWSAVAGDCADDNAAVHPGQVTYFGTPYERSDGSFSFDYDCSNFEEGDLTIPLSPKNCGLLSLALCGGMGYAATNREGPGLNPYCGSGVWSTCVASLAILVCEATNVRRDPPYGCR